MPIRLRGVKAKYIPLRHLTLGDGTFAKEEAMRR